MNDFVHISKRILAAFTLLILTLGPAGLRADGVKTYYKQYSVFSYQNGDYLCEPYTVKKNDWLYKIFRNKGEISKSDFPLFLSIFKKINPKLHNIDAIEPGIRILIPLKKVNRQSFQADEKGNVKVPVVEFSTAPKAYDLTPHTREHVVQSGDTVSGLLDKAYLKKGGGITTEGRKAFFHLNPKVKDIDLVYPGTRVVIPESSLLSQPWFQAFLEQGTAFPANGSVEKPPQPEEGPPLTVLPAVHARQMQQLKRYASLIKGTLVNKGKLHFPGKDGGPDAQLDLSQTPVIETTTPPQKIILIPRDQAGRVLNKDLLKSIKAYWKHLKIEQIEAAIQSSKQLEKVKPPPLKPAVLRQVISDLVAATPYEYIDDDTIGFFIGTLKMTVKLGRIKRPETNDLLLNFGTVYGMGLAAIEKMGFEVLSLPMEGMTFNGITQTLLERLGYTIWQNPSFTHGGMVEPLEGTYAVRKKERIFISQHPLNPSAKDFLEKEHITFHHL